MLGGTLSDALRVARSQARLLVILIPSGRPNKKQPADQKAIESILSYDVSQASNKRARKSGETATGSFLCWGAKAGSPEATTAIKRIKVNPTAPMSKGGKPPTLVVVYPDLVRTVVLGDTFAGWLASENFSFVILNR